MSYNFLVEKNELYYVYNETNKEKEVALTLENIEECTWSNTDIIGFDDEIIAVLIKEKITYIWTYRLKEINED